MNNYGFDYFNYITNVPIPGNMNYGDNQINWNNMNQKSFNQMNADIDKTVDPKVGLVRGNLFANLYDPYKNYKPSELNPNNERDTLLYQILQYKFALIDLKLYLDTHPNDTNCLSLYKQYLTIEKQMCDKYESMYGPLTSDSIYAATNAWNWDNSPWPWEVR